MNTTYKITDQDCLLGERPRSGQYVLRVRDMEEADRPYEKLVKSGPGQLSVAELVAVLWRTGTVKEDVLAMAKRAVHEYGERTLGSELNAQRLADATGIPLTKAAQVIAAFELGRRYYATSAGRPLHIRTAKQAYQHMQSMGYLQKEQLRGLYLNSRYQVVHDEVISVGTLTSNVVHPREVFQPALERGAVAVIVAHNHPSGSLEPTNADVEVTEQLEAAGQILGIELLDHLIISGDRYVSIRETSNI